MEVEGVPLVLPPFVTELRPHQTQAISEVIQAFRDRDVVFLDAPTGAGKTIIGEGVRQIQRAAPHLQANQALYMCTTKSLQDQFVHDFPDSKLIKGRANYPTADNPEMFQHKGGRHLNASMCSKKFFHQDAFPLCSGCHGNIPDYSEQKTPHCDECHPVWACPYELAKTAALKAPLAVVNTAYFLTEANRVGMFGASLNKDTRVWVPKFPFVVIDEADTIEGVLMGFTEVSFGHRYIREYGLGKPEFKTKPDAWLKWADNATTVLGKLMAGLQSEFDNYEDESPPAGLKKELERVSGHWFKVKHAADSIRLNPDNWVYSEDDGALTLKPVTVEAYAGNLLWKHSTKFLLMSASVISPDQMAQELGLTSGQWASVVVDSNFPAERRPIHVRSRANMTAKTKETDWPKMVRAVNEVLDAHPGVRVLVHTVSYAWTQYLFEGLQSGPHVDRILKYDSSGEKEGILETYKHRLDGVLLAPSLDRGVDLVDDLCRVIVITKVPYPNLGDEQIRKRFFGTGKAGKSWYTTQTIRSIVQMTGRGMRHKDDWCITYILDAQFRSNLWSNPIGRNRIPRWWTDALQFEAPKRR